MPFLGITLTLVLGGLAIWHLKMLHSANTHASLVLTAGRPGAGSMDTVDDPVLAEAIFLLALAHDGTNDPNEVRRRVARQIDSVAPGARDELLDYAEWACGSAPDAKDCIRRFKQLWLQRLDGAQRAKLIAMAENVARQDGLVSSQQKITLAALRLSLA